MADMQDQPKWPSRNAICAGECMSPGLQSAIRRSLAFHKCDCIDPTTGERSGFFEWQDGSGTPSASPSPSLSHGETAPGPYHDATGNSQVPQKDIPMVSTPRSCPVPGCRSTRIRVDCSRQTCKTHCLALGGCTNKAHRINQPLASQISQFSSGTQRIYPTFPTPTPNPNASTVIPTTQLPSSSIDQPSPPPPVIDPLLLREPIIHNSGLMPLSVDPLPEPHRCSQMPPIFNMLWQTEQEFMTESAVQMPHGWQT